MPGSGWYGKWNSQKINGFCLKTCPFLHQGNCWNYIRKLILSALECELLVHLVLPNGPGTQTFRAPPGSSNTIKLRSSAKKPQFHLPCLRVTFNLLVMSYYHTEQMMTGLRCNVTLPPGWLPGSKSLRERLETCLITNCTPPTLSVNLPPWSFRPKLFKKKKSAIYKEGTAAKGSKSLKVIIGPFSATLLSTHTSHPAHPVSEKSSLFSTYIQTLGFPQTRTTGTQPGGGIQVLASKCMALKISRPTF